MIRLQVSHYDENLPVGRDLYINVYSALHSLKTAELMLIPRYKIFKPRN